MFDVLIQGGTVIDPGIDRRLRAAAAPPDALLPAGFGPPEARR